MSALPAPLTREAAVQLDVQDPLAPCRRHFDLPDGVLYFDGSSLGPLTHTSRARLLQVIDQQWGRDLIRSWEAHDWIDLPTRVGAKIARLIGAAPDEVLVADSTSINLFKLLAAALELRPGRRVILCPTEEFPTDLYMAQGLATLLRDEEVRVRRVPIQELPSALDHGVAVLSAGHVDFKTGELRDMASLTRAAHAQGALVLWDLSHSAGALEVALGGCEVDLAVGCGYKYLNGGPGAPAFLYVARHLQSAAQSPLWGWLGHRDPFAFVADYQAAPGIARFQCGTPPILSLSALDAALEVFEEVDLRDLRRKSLALGDLFLAAVEQECQGSGLQVATPKEAALRGSQISLRHENGEALMKTLIARGVVTDFRVPDVLRFGLTPLYLRYQDVWDAVQILRDVSSNA